MRTAIHPVSARPLRSPLRRRIRYRRPSRRPNRSVRSSGIGCWTVVASLALVIVALPGRLALAEACWRPPVDAEVADPFRAPSCPWCPGNRGIEYNTGPGEPVRAVAAGTVTFAGSVAGTFYLVVGHSDGLRATYGGLTDVTLGAGDAVVRGMRVGTTVGRLHFGLRQGDAYIDPTPFLGYLVGRARLIPTDGSPERPAPPPVLRCGLRPPQIEDMSRQYRPSTGPGQFGWDPGNSDGTRAIRTVMSVPP